MVSLQLQSGVNKNKEFWSDSTLKLKRLNIACRQNTVLGRVQRKPRHTCTREVLGLQSNSIHGRVFKLHNPSPDTAASLPRRTRASGGGGSLCLHLVPTEQQKVTGACIHHRSWEALPRPIIKT